MISKWLSNGNLKAIALSLLLFVYPILVLSTVSVRYLETIHRITTQQVFDETVFGSTSGDSLASLGFLLLFIAVTFRSTALRIATIIAFSAGVGAFLAGYEQVLLVAGLVTLPFLSALLLIGAFTRRRRSLATSRQGTFDLAGVRVDGKRVVVLFLTIIIILEIGALVRWIAYPIFPSEMYGDPSWKFAELESALFHAFGLLSPVMLVLLAFSFLYKDYIRTLIRKSWSTQANDGMNGDLDALPSSHDKEIISKYHPPANHTSLENIVEGHPEQTISHITGSQSERLLHKPRIPQWTILLCAVAISIILTLYPHLPGVNVSGTGISTDERAYVEWLADLRLVESSEMVSAAFHINSGDRPLSLLLMLALSDATGLSDNTDVRFLPIILAPGLVVSSYLLVRYGHNVAKDKAGPLGNKRIITAVAAIVAAISPQIVVGLYGGFLANWLALIPALIAMLLAIRISDELHKMKDVGSSSKRLAAYSLALYAALTLVMLFHVYTWGYVILVTVLFIIISYFGLRSHRVRRVQLIKVMAILSAVVVASILTDYAKSSYFGVSTGISRDSFVAGSSFDLANFNSRWETLDFTLSAYVGGFLSNPIIIMLALIWALKSSYLRGFDRLVFSTLFILAIPILFGTVVIQARVLYLIPLYIPAVMMLLTQKRDKLISYSLVALALSMAVYALRAVANLYLVLPDGYELEEPFLAS